MGRNGTGKTSLLRLIAGEIGADGGEVRLRPRASIGVVAQDAPSGATTPLDAVLAADAERHALLQERHGLAAGGPEAGGAEDAHRIAEVETRLAEIGAQAAPARAARILKGLGFDDAAQTRPLESFSGGWRMRVALAAVLFAEPDLLLLDEPTNHLDLEASMWLEQHLARYPRTMILISHDRDILDAVPDRILHLEGLKLTAYGGNYSRFERARDERLLHESRARERQALQRRHLQSFVDRFRAKATKARQAQSRLKMLERMSTLPDAPIEPDVRFDFGGEAVPAPPLVAIDRVDVGYGDHVVLRGIDLRLDPEDRVAMLGANGNGKSTLAKLLAGRLAPMAGGITFARQLRVGFFAQHQIDTLEADRTPIEHLTALLSGEREERIRARLARFGLIQSRAETPSGRLSGGERTRLALTLMCLEDPQVLILDEPSNHLDIDSRRALVEAINDFPGAVVLISHDRSLIETTADTLWLVRDGRVRVYDGDIDQYRAEQIGAGASAAAERAQGPTLPPPQRMSAAERRTRLAPLRDRARACETRLEALHRARERLTARLADPATYTDGGDIGALQQDLGALEVEIEKAEAYWLEAEAAIEALAAR